MKLLKIPRVPDKSGTSSVKRVERLEHVPEDQLAKIMKLYEFEGAKVKASLEKGGTFLVEAQFQD